jgi:hypothetical protein
MRTLKAYAGINNVAEPRELTDKDLTVGSNVDLDAQGRPKRRDGFGQASALQHANLWRADGFDVATRGPDGDLVNLTADTVLVPALGHARVHYWNLPDGGTLYSNGTAQGILTATGAAAWGVPIPASIGTAMNVAGQLHPGRYQWSLTHARILDGLEGGPLHDAAGSIDVTTGGILFSDLPVLAGHRTNVYLTSHNGEERFLAGSTTVSGFMFTGKNSALQQRLLTDTLQPPPVGKHLAFWRGRALVAVGSALFASRTNSWHLFDLRRDFKNFAKPITLVLPVQDGIWLGTEGELSFLAGDKWDGLVRQVKASGPVVPGSGVRVPGKYLPNAPDGDGIVCIADGWLVAGTGAGTMTPLTLGRYRTTAAEVSATFRLNGDHLPQYVAIEQ